MVMTSPSYFHQQERRGAARQSSEDSDKVVAEEVATNLREKNAAVKATTSERNAEEATAIDKDFRCKMCDFKSKFFLRFKSLKKDLLRQKVLSFNLLVCSTPKITKKDQGDQRF